MDNSTNGSVEGSTLSFYFNGLTLSDADENTFALQLRPNVKRFNLSVNSCEPYPGIIFLIQFYKTIAAKRTAKASMKNSKIFRGRLAKDVCKLIFGRHKLSVI